MKTFYNLEHPERKLHRGGSEETSVILDGARYPIRRPRVRSALGEVELPTLAKLRDQDLLDEQIQERTIRGVSTRNYDPVVSSYAEKLGVSKSSVSRAFIRASQKDLDALNLARLDEHSFVALMIDGVEYAGRTVSYEQLLLTIRELKLGFEAEAEAFRRMVFNLMGRNCDDHSKNFSFLLTQEGGWDLAPAYDVTFAHNPKGEWTSQHLMSVSGKFEGFEVDDILTFADRFGIGNAATTVSDVRKAIQAWPSYVAKTGIKDAVAEKIKSQLLILK